VARANERRVYDRQARDAVACSILRERLEGLEIIFLVGQDELSAALVRDSFTCAEVIQTRCAFDAQPRLQRSLGIVDAGVDYAAVVRARVHAGARVALENRHAAARLCQFRCDGQPDHARADDGDIHRGVHAISILHDFPDQHVRRVA